MLKETLIGLFSDRREVEATLDELKSNGVLPGDISVLMQGAKAPKEERHTLAGDTLVGAGVGTVTGAIFGGLVGLLVGVGVLTVPGIGAFFTAGPFLAALGITGTAVVTTVSGAFTGALAGGFLGSLVGLGFSEPDAQVYERRIRSGDIVVAVSLRDEPVDSDMTRAVFAKHHAQEVHMLHETVHA